MRARNARSNSPAGARPVRHSPGFDDFMKRVRFAEWQSALVLGELRKLNAKLAEAEKEWER